LGRAAALQLHLLQPVQAWRSCTPRAWSHPPGEAARPHAACTKRCKVALLYQKLHSEDILHAVSCQQQHYVMHCEQAVQACGCSL